jgi:hypothetical protein
MRRNDCESTSEAIAGLSLALESGLHKFPKRSKVTRPDAYRSYKLRDKKPHPRPLPQYNPPLTAWGGNPWAQTVVSIGVAMIGVALLAVLIGPLPCKIEYKF